MWKTITTTNYATTTDYVGINFFPGFTLTWEKRWKTITATNYATATDYADINLFSGFTLTWERR